MTRMLKKHDEALWCGAEESDAPKIGPPTVMGEIPPKLRAVLAPHLGPETPEFLRLPKPKQRDPLTGASRSWILDFDASLPVAKKFIVRVRLRGKRRGVCFVDVAKFLAALRNQAQPAASQ
jgi:hypothetical protein